MTTATIITVGDDFLTSTPVPDPYTAFEAWAAEQGYDLDDSAQLWAAVKAYFEATEPQPARVPCPSCVLRGSQWLDRSRKCGYCGITWVETDAEIWAMVPVKWWIEEGFIKENDMPAVTMPPTSEAERMRQRGAVGLPGMEESR